MLLFFLLSLYSVDTILPVLSSSTQIDRSVFSTMGGKIQERLAYYANSEAIFEKLNSSKSTVIEIFRRELPGRIRLFSEIYQNLSMLCQQGKDGQCDFQKCLVMLAYALSQALSEQDGLTGEDQRLSGLSDTDERVYLKEMKKLIPENIRKSKALEFVENTVESNPCSSNSGIMSTGYRKFKEQEKKVKSTCQAIYSHYQVLANEPQLDEQVTGFLSKMSLVASLGYEVGLLYYGLLDAYTQEMGQSIERGEVNVFKSWVRNPEEKYCRLMNISVLMSIEMYGYFCQIESLLLEATALEARLKAESKKAREASSRGSKKVKATKKPEAQVSLPDKTNKVEALIEKFEADEIHQRLCQKRSNSLFRAIVQTSAEPTPQDFRFILDLVKRFDSSESIKKEELVAALKASGKLINIPEERTQWVISESGGGVLIIKLSIPDIDEIVGPHPVFASIKQALSKVGILQQQAESQ